MIINWFGQSCFRIQGDKSVLVIDPLDKSCGLKVSRLAADIVALTQDQTEPNIKGVTEAEPFIVSNGGEYEVKDTFIYGIPVNPNGEGKKSATKVIYRIEIDGVTLVHLGNISQPLSTGEMEKLEGADILMIPVGGGNTLDAKQATEIISHLEPRIVIPMSYQLPGLKEKLDNIDKFCKEFGVCPTEQINKFKISKKDLPQDDLQVVVLEP